MPDCKLMYDALAAQVADAIERLIQGQQEAEETLLDAIMDSNACEEKDSPSSP